MSASWLRCTLRNLGSPKRRAQGRLRLGSPWQENKRNQKKAKTKTKTKKTQPAKEKEPRKQKKRKPKAEKEKGKGKKEKWSMVECTVGRRKNRLCVWRSVLAAVLADRTVKANRELVCVARRSAAR
jgi:hypothetical protein